MGKMIPVIDKIEISQYNKVTKKSIPLRRIKKIIQIQFLIIET
jgi:hypothetical protein